MDWIWILDWIPYIVAVALILIKFKNAIYKRLYGDRYVPYTIIDTGETGYILFPSDFSKEKHNGVIRIYARDRLIAGVLYYELQNSEPLNLIRDNKKYKYFCDSTNFDTVMNNDILKMLLIIKEKGLIFFTFIFSIVILIAVAYMYMKLGNMEKSLKILVEALEST